jgi:hypothetical protein
MSFRDRLRKWWCGTPLREPAPDERLPVPDEKMAHVLFGERWREFAKVENDPRDADLKE